MTSVAIALDLMLSAALVFVFASAGRWFGPRGVKHEGDAGLPYETGMPPLAPAGEHMGVLYYRFAVLFVVFDVDLAFLLPWALNRSALDLPMMCALTVFVGLIGFMLAYFWRKGALECK